MSASQQNIFLPLIAFYLLLAGSKAEFVTLTVAMTSVDGNGWSNNLISIKQGGRVVGTFGNTFRTGTQSDPVQIEVEGNLLTDIAVYQADDQQSKIGFLIKAPNGTTIYEKLTGTTYGQGVIGTFCPKDGCFAEYNLYLMITMTDTAGDGWGGNVVGIRQKGKPVETFGDDF